MRCEGGFLFSLMNDIGCEAIERGRKAYGEQNEADARAEGSEYDREKSHRKLADSGIMRDEDRVSDMIDAAVVWAEYTSSELWRVFSPTRAFRMW